MDAYPIDFFHLLIFTIPGFFVVWSYKQEVETSKLSDFEYLMFSIIWGIIMLAILGYVSEEQMKNALQNIYAATLVFSCLGVIFGTVAGYLTKRLFK